MSGVGACKWSLWSENIEMCGKTLIPCQMLDSPENEPVNISQLLNVLEEDSSNSAKKEFASVAIVHCETTSGVRNPIGEIGQILKKRWPHLLYVVDAMSSFGCLEEEYSSVDFLISSANKCLQGVPGCGFVIARKAKLEQCQGRRIFYGRLLFFRLVGSNICWVLFISRN
jgi:2-aminoethylphosphonate-pyruvate transaminase